MRQLTRVSESTGRLLTMHIESNDDVDTHRSIQTQMIAGIRKREKNQSFVSIFRSLCTYVATSGIQEKNPQIYLPYALYTAIYWHMQLEQTGRAYCTKLFLTGILHETAKNKLLLRALN